MLKNVKTNSLIRFTTTAMSVSADMVCELNEELDARYDMGISVDGLDTLTYFTMNQALHMTSIYACQSDFKLRPLFAHKEIIKTFAQSVR